MKKLQFILILGLTLGSCTKDKAVEVTKAEDSNKTYCDTVTVSFSSNIKPIFIQSCATSGCHNAGTSASGYTLENYNQIASNIEISLKTIKHESTVSGMPKFQAPLHDSLIQKIECWISQGKLNN